MLLTRVNMCKSEGSARRTDGEPMATRSEDVARAAGVSRPAVSQILNGRGRFSAETIQRVRAVAADMGYQPSAAARSLATGTSDVVVALVPDTTFGTNLQDGFDALTTQLASAGLTLVLRLSSSPVELLEHFVKTTRPRAVLASFGPIPPRVREILHDAEIPLVGDDAERLDRLNRDIGRLQAEHLFATGCTRLAYAHLHDDRQDVFGDPREQGVVEACAAAGFAPPLSLRVGLTAASAVEAVAQLPAGCIGIACYNDDVAIALLDGCRSSDRPVPDDVAIIGMDATPISSLIWPRLTTLALDSSSAIAALGHAVIEQITGGAVASATVDLNAQLRLVPGGTTGPAPVPTLDAAVL